MRADALMRPAANDHVALVVALQIERQRLAGNRGIAIGGRQEEDDALAPSRNCTPSKSRFSAMTRIGLAKAYSRNISSITCGIIDGWRAPGAPVLWVLPPGCSALP